MLVVESLPMETKILPWSFGVVVFSHLGTFFSISFFDQTISLVYFIFAVTTFLKTQTFQTSPEEPAPEPGDFISANTDILGET
jgi:hypothetical protein